jgi:glycosyltransferase involved in cell wall biosynthesis
LYTSSFYPPYHLGGDAVHVKYLAEEIVERGHEVHVLHSLDAYNVKRKTSPQVADTKGVHIHPIKTHINLSSYAAYMLGNYPSTIKKFKHLVNDVKPDIVHHHNISLLGYGILKKVDNYLNLYTAHDYWLICQQNSLLTKGFKTCEGISCISCALRCGRSPQLWRSFSSFRTAINNIDLLITPSDYVRKQLAQKIDVKIVTVPNFVPTHSEEIYSGEDSPYFLFVGTLEIHKGLIPLLELFKELRNEIDAKLIIVGNGSLKNYVTDFIEKNSLNSSISYLGFVDDEKLLSLFKGASAVIIPSIWPENAPLVALEALSVGTPVIASNNGGLPEIVEKVDKKLIFRDRTELKNLLLNFNEAMFPPTKIKEVYEKNFSPKAYIDRYINLIRSSELQPSKITLYPKAA